jgi:hypothetical protein
MPDVPMLDHYRRLAQDTTIDSNTLLSTDFFNHFNEVIMLLSMLADMPDMLEEIRAWRPKTYREHFEQSGLAFAPLAIEAYDHVPPEFRGAFDATVDDLNATIAEGMAALEDMAADPDMFAFTASSYWQRLQALVDQGSAIVHGSIAGSQPSATLDQSAIDDLF